MQIYIEKRGKCYVNEYVVPAFLKSSRQSFDLNSNNQIFQLVLWQPEHANFHIMLTCKAALNEKC